LNLLHLVQMLPDLALQLEELLAIQAQQVRRAGCPLEAEAAITYAHPKGPCGAAVHAVGRASEQPSKIDLSAGL